jgi:hypothetical protein
VPTAEPANPDHHDLLPSGAIALAPHPACRAGPVRSVHATATLAVGGCIVIEFALRGELSRLRLAPAASAPQRREELWRHTCFELFARRGTDRGYLEFNFSPSGDWAAWSFSDYRHGQRPLENTRVKIATLPGDAGCWRVRAQAELGAAETPSPWWLNLAAVIEADDGGLTYWAVRHTSEHPDFHDRANFAVPLAAARAAAPVPDCTR